MSTPSTDPSIQTPRAASTRAADASPSHDGGDGASYLRFIAMIATSVLVMFALKYTSTYALDHVWFSETRAWMAVAMGGAMAIVMLLFMLGMYKNTKINAGIILGSLVLLAGGIFFVRSQATVDGVDYMEGMIPHHSIAVLTSERSDIDDLRVRKLANEIIIAQRREIKEMEWLIADIEENGEATTVEEADQRPVPKFEGEVDPEGGEVTQPQEEEPLEE